MHGTDMDQALLPLPNEGREQATRFQWPRDYRAAVSFTFDDARASQARVGAPRLSDYEIRGTFYVVADAVRGSLPEWRNAIEAGHEIGNHTHRHPCCRALGVSETVLEDYSIEEIEKDIRTASWEIADLLQVEPRSFAYPCGNAFVGRGPTRQSYVPLVAGMFQSGRGYPHAEANDPLHCNFEYLKSAKLDDVSYEVADRLIGEALQSGGWLIFTGHETPADDEILPALLRRVSEDSAVWADTVGTIADYVLATR